LVASDAQANNSTQSQEILRFEIAFVFRLLFHFDNRQGLTSVAISVNGKEIIAGKLHKMGLGLNDFDRKLWHIPVGNQARQVTVGAEMDDPLSPPNPNLNPSPPLW